MGFFDDLAEKTKEVATKASDKAKDMAGIAKLKADLATEKRKIKDQNTLIGQLYYENYSAVPDDIFTEAVDKIKESEDVISTKEKELSELKDENGATVVPEDEFCPKCGVKLNKNSAFCSKCGTKIEEK